MRRWHILLASLAVLSMFLSSWVQRDSDKEDESLLFLEAGPDYYMTDFDLDMSG